MRNKLNMEFFSCKKYKDVFKIYICGFACMNKLGNQSVSVQVFQPVLQWWNDRPVLLIIRSAKACLWPRLSEPKSFSTLRPMEYRPAKYVLYVVVVVSRTVVVLRNLVFFAYKCRSLTNCCCQNILQILWLVHCSSWSFAAIYFINFQAICTCRGIPIWPKLWG